MMLLLLFAAGIIVGITGSTAINAQLAASRARPIFSADLKGVPGQEILFSLHPLIGQLAEDTLTPDLSLLGLCCAGFDTRCMQHETLYSRLYMS